MDLSNVDNNGLQEPLEALQEIVNKYATYLTRADVWILAGLTACQESVGFFNDPVASFAMEYVGRPVCNNPTGGPPQVFPSPNFVTQQVLTYFNDTFAFDTRESVAILGAHTLGTASRQNSGLEVGGAGWTVFAGWAAWFDFSPDSWAIWGLLVTTAYLLMAGAVQQIMSGERL